MNFLFFTMETVSNLSAWINHKITKEKKLKDLYRAKQTPEEKGNTFSRSGDRVVCGGNWREQSRETSITTMVLKTGTDKEPEKRLIIGFMVRPGSDRWSNR